MFHIWYDATGTLNAIREANLATVQNAQNERIRLFVDLLKSDEFPAMRSQIEEALQHELDEIRKQQLAKTRPKGFWDW